MTDTFCSTFTCRNRGNCKRALIVDELQRVEPFVHIDGYCRGFIPLTVSCVESTSWLDKLFNLNWRFL